MKTLFVVDPLHTLDPGIDASIGLMLAARRHGLEVWVCGPTDLRVVAGRVLASAREINPVEPSGANGARWTVPVSWCSEGPPGVLDVAAEFTQVHLRIDPPVDARYLHATYLLDLVHAAGTPVTNRPSGIRALHEKLLTLGFPELCPATLVSAGIADLRAFIARFGTVVLKPVDGFAGTDVWLVRDDDTAAALLASATVGGTRHVIAQEYLAAVRQGNKRLFLLDGEVIGAVLRLPADDDFRIGMPAQTADLDADDERIVAALRPLLSDHGIVLAGLDVIAGRLIEVNVTCPGGMHKTDALLGTDLSGAIVRRLLHHAPTTLPKGRRSA
ncbi:MAG: hypothetical protein NTV23_16955 [Propionibacteriales bacterium]|nr:hypothetical protein [Propionibacteriales bacterium]